MTYWIFLWNNKKFDLDGSLRDLDYVDWRQTNRLEVGDRVLIYATGSVARLTHLLEVTKLDIPHEQIDNNKYRLGSHDTTLKPVKYYCRLEPLAYLDPNNPEFARKNLLELGFSSKAMANFKCNNAISDMVLKNIDEATVESESAQKLFQEGTMKMPIHKRYERSLAAREECIKAKGCKCYVCGFDFEEAYGELGKGYVEVHHTSFISNSEGKERLTDPIKDLIPVCSNCHSMLHRKLNGEYLSPDRLKQLMGK